MCVWCAYAGKRDASTCGLVHSRTASGGDDRRAHPYVGSLGDVALASQGSSGRFPAAPFIACGNRLLAEGVRFRSAAADGSKCPALDDGSKVSMSDIVVNAVEAEYRKNRDPLAAVRTVCGELGEESATLFLFRDRPGFIGNIPASCSARSATGRSPRFFRTRCWNTGPSRPTTSSRRCILRDISGWRPSNMKIRTFRNREKSFCSAGNDGTVRSACGDFDEENVC